MGMRTERGGVRAWIAAAFALVFVAAGLAVGRVALRGPAPSRHDGLRSPERSIPAPDFQGIGEWINSSPLTVSSLRGKVLIIDFWTFSCVNCVRTIPTLRALYERYKPFGLEIVGVHSPEFKFESIPRNVRAAVDRLRVTWPVALDNDFVTWQAYDNHYWPHVYFIDRSGLIRYDHIGEGDEAEQESALRALLAEDGRNLPAAVSPAEPSFGPHLTPEVYLGRARGLANNTIANPEGYRGRQEVLYTAPSQQTLDAAPPDGHVYLGGRWQPDEEFIRAKARAQLYLPFNARTVFMVAESASPTQVRLTLDGKPLDELASADASGGAVRVHRADLYALVALPETGRHVLELDVDAGVKIYTFTFG